MKESEEKISIVHFLLEPNLASKAVSPIDIIGKVIEILLMNSTDPLDDGNKLNDSDCIEDVMTLCVA